MFPISRSAPRGVQVAQVSDAIVAGAEIASTSGRGALEAAAPEIEDNFAVANSDDDLRKILTKAAGRLVRAVSRHLPDFAGTAGPWPDHKAAPTPLAVSPSPLRLWSTLAPPGEASRQRRKGRTPDCCLSTWPSCASRLRAKGPPNSRGERNLKTQRFDV